MVSPAVTPMFCRYSVYITDAPRKAQWVIVSGRPVCGLTSGTISASVPLTSGVGRTQTRLNTSRAGAGMSSAG